MNHPADTLVDVAVGVILRADGSFLLARRPPGKPYAGYWEFPGGKVEAGEPVAEALGRELQEELGIHPDLAYPWITQVFAYPHATVKLHFYRVVGWQGEPHPHEGQVLSWQRAEQVDVAPLLPANGPVLKALSLPPVYAISNAAELGTERFMQHLEPALQGGLRLLQVREKHMPFDALWHFAVDVVAIAHRYGARVLLNSDAELARAVGADGVHLTASQLAQLETRPDVPWCGASCHTRAELERAARIGADFVVLGPLQPTLTHPGATSMGWPAFSESIRDFPLPVYALGGLRNEDLETAWQHGAHGIGMQRGAWAEQPA